MLKMVIKFKDGISELNLPKLKIVVEFEDGIPVRSLPQINDCIRKYGGEAVFTETDTKDAVKYYYLSELLITKIRLSGTEMKLIPEKVIPKWAQDFRLMVEQDNRKEPQIEAMIEAIFADVFWSRQVRCASKLRKNWNEGKFDRLKSVQGTQEYQEQAKKLTPWEELCRDSGDPGQRVWDRLIKIWEEMEGKKWQNFSFLPKNTSDIRVMKPIFEIMQEYRGRNFEMLCEVRKYLAFSPDYY